MFASLVNTKTIYWHLATTKRFTNINVIILQLPTLCTFLNEYYSKVTRDCFKIIQTCILTVRLGQVDMLRTVIARSGNKPIA